MSIVRAAEYVSQNKNGISFTLRFPPGHAKPTPTVVNLEDGRAYVKLAYQPSIFETVLPWNVEQSATKLRIDIEKNEVVFSLQRQADQSPREWTKPIKETLKIAKQLARDQESVLEPKRVQAALTLKDQTKKKSVGSAMTMDQEVSKDREAIIEKAKWKALGDMGLDDDDDEQDFSSIHLKADKAIDEAIARAARRKKFMKNIKLDEAKSEAQTAPIRRGNVTVELSERVFPTAARGSTAAEEQDWLEKQAMYRKRIEVDNPDLKEHEKDPVWLKEKGNKLLRTDNLESAAHAYTLALKITPNDPTLYLNRAAAHLKFKNHGKCIDDCEKAINLLTPPVEQNKNMRAKAFVRRSAAFTALGMFDRAIDDLQHAHALTGDSKLKDDLLRLKDAATTASDGCLARLAQHAKVETSAQP